VSHLRDMHNLLFLSTRWLQTAPVARLCIIQVLGLVPTLDLLQVRLSLGVDRIIVIISVRLLRELSHTLLVKLLGSPPTLCLKNLLEVTFLSCCLVRCLLSSSDILLASLLLG
jgi:hypothetical protein